ncbi:MAG: T9SS type A sorting domain-containing protein, partial [Chitinophagaceae bacterium]
MKKSLLPGKFASKRKFVNAFFILIAIFFCNLNLYAQAGTLDPTFGDGGMIIENTYNSNSHSIILPDGKILLIGEYAGLGIDRFNPDGSYDESFGINGRYSISLNGKLSGPDNKTFALLDDGRIICATRYFPKGYTGNKLDMGLVRLKANGTLDSSFGVNGLDTLELDIITRATGLVVQPDGKIVISGDVQKNVYNEKRTFICRFMPDGGLDPTFGEEGIVVSTYAYATLSNSLVINAAGKLIRGSTYDLYGGRAPFMLESFNSDGSQDADFGKNGVAKYVFGDGQGGTWNNGMFMMAQQTDGKLVCTGESGRNENIFMALCRFNADGSVDASFGDGGGIIVPYKNSDVYSYELCFQPDGKIITLAFAIIYPFPGITLVRYTSSGQLDPSFGKNGISAVYNDTAHIGASSVHILSDGKIFTTGQLTTYIGQKTYTLLARFNNDNVLAANFKEVKASQNNEAITISWQTLNESGTKSFTVERSSNANDFVGINTVPAKGVASNYSYTDKHPLSGTSYYRIRENAANGTNTFSPVVKVVFNDNGIISLFPNPAKNTVTVKGLNKNTIATIRITDMNGREINKQNFQQSSSATLNIR